MTHSAILIDGMSLPLFNIEIMITGSRSGNGDTSPYAYVLYKWKATSPLLLLLMVGEGAGLNPSFLLDPYFT